jgi:hypothetical protein
VHGLEQRDRGQRRGQYAADIDEHTIPVTLAYWLEVGACRYHVMRKKLWRGEGTASKRIMNRHRPGQERRASA